MRRGDRREGFLEEAETEAKRLGAEELEARLDKPQTKTERSTARRRAFGVYRDRESRSYFVGLKTPGAPRRTTAPRSR